MNVKVNQKIANLTEVTSVDLLFLVTKQIRYSFSADAQKVFTSKIRRVLFRSLSISEEGFDFDSILVNLIL